jgi:hypothetical protein
MDSEKQRQSENVRDLFCQLGNTALDNRWIPAG